MTNFNQIAQGNIDYLTKQEVELQAKLDAIKQTKEETIHAINCIDFVKLEKCFSKLKLEPTFRNVKLPESREYLIVELVAKPLEGSSVKFVLHSGYDSRGRSRNHDKRHNRARKLESKIQELTGYRTSINEFSLQIETQDEKKSVMISLCINK